MKPLRILIPAAALLLLYGGKLPAQERQIDSLKNVLRATRECDTTHISALSALGEIFMRREPEQGMRYSMRVLEVSERCGYRKGSAIGHVGLALFFWGRGELDSALAHCGIALSLADEKGSEVVLANAHNALGAVCSMRGERIEALKHFNAALKIRESMGNKRAAAAVLNNIGIQYFDRNLLDRAAAHFERALRTAEETGDESGKADYLLNLGNCQADDGKAFEYYSKSLSIYERLDLLQGVAKSKYHLALLRQKQGDLDGALSILKQVLDAARLLANGELVLSSATLIGEIYRRQGNVDSASAHLYYALQRAEQSGSVRWLSAVNTSLARLYGYTPSLRWLALQHAEEAMNLARRDDDRVTEKTALEALSEIFEQEGDLARALALQREVYALHDSITRESNAKHVNELTALYEADGREKEINLLMSDRALKEAELKRQSAELARSALEATQQTQRLALLSKQRDLERSDAEKTRAELALQKEAAARRSREAALLAKENQLKTSVLARERQFRNSILGGAVLLVIAAVLGFKRLQGLKREAALRAEAAEYKTRSVQAEAVEREREAQRLFSQRLIESQEDERKRLAGELHDELGQELLIIKHRAQLALSSGNDGDAHLREIVETADEAISNVRKVSRNLRPYQLERAGLTATLRSMLESVSRSTDMELEVELAPIDGLLPRDREIDMFRIVQEGLNNILKHSAATGAGISIKTSDDSLLLKITDNGKGFDTAAGAAGPGDEPGLGLKSISERVRMLGGELRLFSTPGRGTELTVTVPINESRVGECGGK